MLTETEISACSQNKTSPVNVLFVGKRPISNDLIGLLTEHRYSWELVGLDEFEQSADSRSIFGTVVFDASEISDDEMDEFQRILEDLDRRNIALILYNTPELLNLETLPLASRIDSIDLNEVWARIDSNVRAYKRFGQNTPREIHPFGELKVGEDLQKQLEMAGHVQRNFLPSHLPHTEALRWAAVFRPADWVSGDIYDIRRLDEHNIGFYLADAVGHSMPAALLTMFLKQATVMRQTIGHEYNIFQPWEVMKTLNQRMAEQELAGCLFATSFYATLNTETLTLKYVRAGHPYPLLIRDNRIMPLQSRGGLLGVFPDAEFEQKTLQLQPHDKLFVYSDGGEPLIGQNQEDASFHFTEPFRKICRLGIDEMLSAYHEMAEHHSFGPGQIDDISAVGLEIL